MKNVIDALVALQDRDRRLLKLIKEGRDIPQRKKEIETQIVATQERVDSTNKRLQEKMAACKTHELEIESAKGRLAKYQQDQLIVKNNDQYKAVALEIDMVAKLIDKLEFEFLKMIDSVDAFKEDVAKDELFLKEERERVQDEVDMLTQRYENLKERVTKLKEDRIIRIAEITEMDPAAIRLYSRIMNNKKDFALVPVEGGSCGGCHMALTPQVINDAKSDRLTNCGHCGRIVYADEVMG